MEITRPTFMEVNLNNFKYNIEQIRNKVGIGVELMPVIKANGYGTWINTRIDILNMFNIVAVATVDEAVYIRSVGYDKDIFVLNQPYESEIKKIIENNITVGISALEFAKMLGCVKKDVKVHIEIGTGMGRTGIHPNRVKEFIEALPENLKVEGIYTHMSSPDVDDEYTKKQLYSFNVAVEMAKKMLDDIKYVHAAASNALLNYENSYFNLVRPGLIIYGYPSEGDIENKIDIRPIAKLKSKVTFLKEVEMGTSIGYGRSYITDKKTKVATVPLGYADGFRRTFSNGWNVMVNGAKVPIIGKVCMDSFMLDVTEINDVRVGDEVIIWDNENIMLEDLAKKCDTINYEILSTIGARVPRKFVE